MEVFSGAYYWAPEFTKLGHNMRSMASKFVILYWKNEKNDAEAICGAATGLKARFVSIKNEEQQAVLCLHHIRQGARVVIANCKNKIDQKILWVKVLVERRGFKRATVALAAKKAD